jgi:hypothetical protein
MWVPGAITPSSQYPGICDRLRFANTPRCETWVMITSGSMAGLRMDDQRHAIDNVRDGFSVNALEVAWRKLVLPAADPVVLSGCLG